MLFNSPVFLFIFLPITLAGFALVSRLKGPWVYLWLLATSLVFYGWWNFEYLGLLIASIFVNYLVGGYVDPDRRADIASALKLNVLVLGIFFNLALLGYYKYTGFLYENVSDLFGLSVEIPDIVLPLGISFFTFQQIAYLVDRYRGVCSPHGLLRYCVFVSFFPQLIAGPIVHHREIFPQLDRPKRLRFRLEQFSIGLCIVVIGLFKKIVIADSLARYATPVFAAADQGASITFVDAWAGTLAYTFQLYFDFSAYSDMAIGLGRMFGLRLPLNFFSPYKATSISDFWRRWHITLSRFLRDYVYIPLGGNALGFNRQLINIMLTMVIGGLWHGAGWGFVVWGGFHGILIAANHLWRRLAPAGVRAALPAIVSWALTFLCIAVGWTFFRAETLSGAVRVLAAMADPTDALVAPIASDLFPMKTAVAYLGLAGAVAFLAPNTYEIMARYRPVVSGLGRKSPPILLGVMHRFIGSRLSARWGLAAGLLFIASILKMSGESPFLYFQF